MTITRPQGDIAFVTAYGYGGTSIVLDSLVWGPAASATTNSDGVYNLGYLPDGTYHIHVSPPAGYSVTTPASGYATVTVSSGQVMGEVNFGITAGSVHPYHNVANPYNVNNDPQNSIAPIDALMVINWLNAHAGAEGEIPPGQDPNVIGYLDVDDDGFCAPRDALMVINYINAHPPGGGEGETAGNAGLAAGSSSGSGPGEGEGQVQVPQNAAEYYAQQPIHLQHIPGTDEDCMDAVTPTRSSVGAVSMATNAAAAAAPRLTPESSSDLDATGAGGWGKLASAKLSSPTVSSILANNSASTGSSALSGPLFSSRKHAADSLADGDQLEQTLEEIAADVAEFETRDAGDSARLG
jgi:hypothetical protein